MDSILYDYVADPDFRYYSNNQIRRSSLGGDELFWEFSAECPRSLVR